MGWIKWTGKALELAGKMAQAQSFEDWARGKGQAIIEKVAVNTGGSLFKSANSKAKNAIWNELADQFKGNDTFVDAMEKAVAGYTARFSKLVADKSSVLPHPPTSNIRVLPRSLVNNNELKYWRMFDSSQELANLKGGPELREYFFEEMVAQLDSSFSSAAISAKPDEPIQLEDRRWVIGFSLDYEWSGRKGHYYVFSYYDQTASGAKKKERNEARQKAASELKECRDWLFHLDAAARQKLSVGMKL